MQFIDLGETARPTPLFHDRLTLRDLLGVPFPSELVSAPQADQVAWVFNESGCRNIWVSLANGPGCALTAYRDDANHDLRELSWLPGGDGIVFTRGSLPGDEEPKFPAAPPVGTIAPQIWLASLNGNAPRLLADGQTPKVSPMGDRVAYLVNGQIWTVPLAGNAVPELLVSNRGVCGSLAWSPDGSLLAFVSDRGDQSFVGLIEIASRSVRWISPGVDQDAFPSWSPDGRRIAFIRLADQGAATYTTRRCGTPWSLWIADAASGSARCVWSARPGQGSVFSALASGPQLVWTSDGRIVFPWEGSGWRHLYALDVTSYGVTEGTVEGEAQDLTPGAFEVFEMSAAEAGNAIVCSGNRDDLDRRHLWRIDLLTNRMSAVTSGMGIEVSPAPMTSGRIAMLRSDARMPLQPALIAAAGRMQPIALQDRLGGLLCARLVEPQIVVFESADGLDLHAQLFLPTTDCGHARYPAIVHFHGGPVRQMMPAWHPMESYHRQYGFNQYLVSLGYVVLSVNYRGGDGYGLDFREPLEFGAGGASEHQDAVAAAAYLRSRGEVDATRIGAYGFSYGGLMTALALARSSDLFAAGVDCAGVSDWSPAFAGPQTHAGLAEIAFRSSPLASVDQWRSPVLFMHADDDRTVPFNQTVGIIKALRRQPGVEVEHVIIPDEQHDFVRHSSWEQVFAAITDFFMRRLT